MEVSLLSTAKPFLRAFLFIVIASLCYFFISLYKARMLFIRRKRAGLPCAPNHNFIFGHLLYLKSRMDALPANAHYQYMFADIAHKHFQDEGMFYVDLWPASGMMIIVTSPTVATQVAQTNQKLCMDRAAMLKRFFKPIAGGPNLFDMPEREWRPWRQIFNKGFSAEHINSLVPLVVRETEVYKQRLTQLAQDSKMFYLDLVTLRFTIDIIGQTILKAHLKAQNGYNVLADSMMSQIRWHQPNAEANPLGHLNFIRWMIEWWNGRNMDLYIGKEIDKRFAELDLDDKGTKTVIDLVLQAYVFQAGKEKPKKLDSEFRAFAIRQVRLFLFTGHDSTSSTICYVFHLLSQHPNSLAKLREEHDRILGKDVSTAPSLLNENPTLLNDLPYTTAVIKETLRLFPPAASSRQGKPDVTITDDLGTLCPTDDVIMLWTLHVELHRHPKYWPHPNSFLPERWLVDPGHELYPVQGAWRAFEHGPRNCIAQGIVMMELRVVLALCVREFEVRDAYAEWDRQNGVKERREYRGERAYQMEEAAAHPVEHYPCYIEVRGKGNKRE